MAKEREENIKMMKLRPDLLKDDGSPQRNKLKDAENKLSKAQKRLSEKVLTYVTENYIYMMVF